jgi:transcriptional regulator ATRX
MINFAFPNYFGEYDQFRRRFEVPILNGQCKDSTRWDIRKARQRAYVLNKEIKPLVLRRGAKFLYSMLPPKKEWVIQVRMVKLQGDLYRAYLRHHQKKMGDGNREILSAFQISLMIVNHPDLLFRAMIRSRDKMQREQQQGESNRSNNQIEQKSVDEDLDDDSDIEFVKECNVEKHDYSWAESLLENHKLNLREHSGKMLILMKILEYSVRMNERITVFSQSLGTLDIIQNLLRKSNESLSSSGYYFYFLRIDGGTSLPHRFERIQRFNDPKDKTNVMLVSTRAGGEGVNLVGGTRVVLFDCCWNPCHDHQSMCRSHRYGQTKPVYVYRLVGNGTMEKKIYDLQIRKEGLSKRIVDNDATQRHFRSDELNEYMSMEQYKKEMNAELSGNDDVGDDKIMARLIKGCSKYVVFEREARVS